MGYTFQERDLSLLEKTMRLRERMMDNIAIKSDKDLPVKASEVMAVTNLLESIDRSVYSKAKIDIDSDAQQNDQSNKVLLRQLLIDIHSNRGAPTLELEHQSQEPPQYRRSETIALSSGELITGTDNYIGEN